MAVAYFEINQRDQMPSDVNIFHAWTGFESIGYATRFFTKEEMLMDKTPIRRDTPVIAKTPALVEWAMKKVGAKPPALSDYPAPLNTERFLKRDIRRGTLAYFAQHWQQLPMFVKPVQKKLFTGKLVVEWPLPVPVAMNPLTTEVYVSAPVHFVSEMRVFVHHGLIEHVCHYDGDPFIACDKETVVDAVNAYSDTTNAPVAYAADFGVIYPSGETALVEVNDFYAIGAYTLGAETYAGMLTDRWNEICNNK